MGQSGDHVKGNVGARLVSAFTVAVCKTVSMILHMDEHKIALLFLASTGRVIHLYIKLSPIPNLFSFESH